MRVLSSWQIFALGSAFFAALTAICGKIGVTGIHSSLATFLRTLVIVMVTAAILTLRGEWQRPEVISSRTVLFLVLS
jgi:transporter family protein